MNKLISVIPLIFLVSLIFGSCKEKPEAMENPIVSDAELGVLATESVFDYTGYARNGSVIVRGHLTILLQDSGSVGGRWQLRALADTSRIGPQHGQGRLLGHLRSGVLNINLNPNYVDNNILLTGRFTRDRYVGQWSWVGFAGVLTTGTFQAVRVRRPAEENAD
jgi:hypothetical protein